ncbi:glutathione S-transferase 1 [Bombus affinis]|uniref:glutathione S-transferase 1 n=1 Tax=Bombus affinis TaxID=309941 RepID=UPI0021B75D31|nr:glutathione S-transferase 1 [Bombus affinis]XP_050581173.1 glutathione S-transferase 1 [Bombus affinis]XP_050581174.1 glutathione S-transferase 1 [Bombus affinis]
MKLYSVSDGPPSLACRQALKALNIQYELIDVDFGKGDHMTNEYAQLNPQKEIPVLVDDDLIMGESNAILQYLGDKYDTAGKLYPKDPESRAIVNHRLCFNLAMYYRSISEYVMAPIFFDYKRTSLGLKKMTMALDVFNTYLQREHTEYVAGNTLTIADFPLVTATMCLEAIDFKLNSWPYIEKWYNNFKQKHPELWEIAAEGMREISYYEKNPPDLSDMDHPIHPIRKTNK